MLQLKIERVGSIVHGQEAEVVVTIENPTDRPVGPTTVTLQSNEPGLLVTPSPEFGGYALAEGVAARSTERRPFALRAVHADTGRTIHLEANAKIHGAPGQPPQFVGPEGLDVDVEARPEFYAAIGAAERLRSGLAALYEDLKEAGKESQQRTGAHFAGGAPSEPLKVALGDDAFRWVMGMVEFGTRLYRVQTDAAASSQRRADEEAERERQQRANPGPGATQDPHAPTQPSRAPRPPAAPVPDRDAPSSFAPPIAAQRTGDDDGDPES